MKNNLFKLDNNIFTRYDENINMFFSTINDGVSTNEYKSLNLGFHVGDDYDKVVNNRIIYANKINTDLDHMIFCNQTHSDNFKLVTMDDMGRGSFDFNDGIDNCDAIYTFDQNIYLNAYYADCTPVYFYSKVDNLIGIIHAGWQGSVKQITKKTLSHIINNHNISKDNLVVIIGPSISFDNFEVEIDVINQVKKMDNYTGCIRQNNEVKYNVDVKRLNYLQAKDLGINQVHVSDIDTFDNDLLFSYRKNNKTGRMCATIGRI